MHDCFHVSQSSRTILKVISQGFACETKLYHIAYYVVLVHLPILPDCICSPCSLTQLQFMMFQSVSCLTPIFFR